MKLVKSFCFLLQAGEVRISTKAATLENLAQQFWHRILALADLNDDQLLSLSEFQTLMQVWVDKQQHHVACTLL